MNQENCFVNIDDVIAMILQAANLRHIDSSTLHRNTKIINGDLDLDSIDILELVVLLEKKYNVKIRNAQIGQKVFQTLGTLVDFLEETSTTKNPVSE